MKRTFFFAWLILLLSAGFLRADFELRGAWIYDPREQDADQVTARLRAAGFNAVFVRLSSGGAAYYPSRVMPTAPSSGDQARIWTQAAHRHGMQIHAWHVCFMMHNAPSSEMNRVISRGEAMIDGKGRVIRPSYGAVVRAPAADSTLEFEKDAMVELAKKYKVDGVQFDYIRYPSFYSDYSKAARRRFGEDTGKMPLEWPGSALRGSRRAEFLRWRQKVVTGLVRDVSRAVRAANSDVQISAAVWSHPSIGREEFGQDWPAWVKAGYLDFVCPMSYTRSDKTLAQWTRIQKEAVGGKVPIYPGLGAYMLSTPAQLNRQIEILRKAGMPGYVLYNGDNRTLKRFVPYIKD